MNWVELGLKGYWVSHYNEDDGTHTVITRKTAGPGHSITLKNFRNIEYEVALGLAREFVIAHWVAQKLDE